MGSIDIVTGTDILSYIVIVVAVAQILWEVILVFGCLLPIEDWLFVGCRFAI